MGNLWLLHWRLVVSNIKTIAAFITIKFIIIDLKDYAAMLAKKEKEKKPEKKKEERKYRDDKARAKEEADRKRLQACQILERMVNQNIYDEIAQGIHFF